MIFTPTAQCAITWVTQHARSELAQALSPKPQWCQRLWKTTSSLVQLKHRARILLELKSQCWPTRHKNPFPTLLAIADLQRPGRQLQNCWLMLLWTITADFDLFVTSGWVLCNEELVCSEIPMWQKSTEVHTKSRPTAASPCTALRELWFQAQNNKAALPYSLPYWKDAKLSG